MAQEEVFTDVSRCLELSKEKASITEELETLYERWETLSEDL
jgi:ATP-binding cassette subfamily F protein 3